LKSLQEKKHHSMCIQKKYHDIPRGVTFAAFEQIDTMDFNNLYISWWIWEKWRQFDHLTPTLLSCVVMKVGQVLLKCLPSWDLDVGIGCVVGLSVWAYAYGRRHVNASSFLVPQRLLFFFWYSITQFSPEEIVCMVVFNKEWFLRSTWCMAPAFYFLSILCLYKTCRSQKTRRVILYIYILCKSL
jgi:hypothetical protein